MLAAALAGKVETPTNQNLVSSEMLVQGMKRKEEPVFSEPASMKAQEVQKSSVNQDDSKGVVQNSTMKPPLEQLTQVVQEPLTQLVQLMKRADPRERVSNKENEENPTSKPAMEPLSQLVQLMRRAGPQRARNEEVKEEVRGSEGDAPVEDPGYRRQSENLRREKLADPGPERAMTASDLLPKNMKILPRRTGVLFGEIDDPEFKRFCQRLHRKLNHDPWDEFKRYDDDDVRDYMEQHPETCDVKYDFDSFSGHIYPLSMLCSLGASARAIRSAYHANPAALHECDLWIGTPLHYACSYRAPAEVADFLVQRQPEALEMTNHFSRTPLHMACLFRAPVATVSLLLKRCPQVAEAADKDGYTPLHLACENGASPETVELLVSANPNLAEAKTRYDSTPLHFACAKNASKAVVQILLNCNSDVVTHMDLMGQTPMHMAAGGGASAAVIELLVQADPEGLDALTDKGETPLRIAKRKKAPESVLKLLTPS